jgi:hypothetical protein
MLNFVQPLGHFSFPISSGDHEIPGYYGVIGGSSNRGPIGSMFTDNFKGAECCRSGSAYLHLIAEKYRPCWADLRTSHSGRDDMLTIVA